MPAYLPFQHGSTTIKQTILSFLYFSRVSLFDRQFLRRYLRAGRDKGRGKRFASAVHNMSRIGNGGHVTAEPCKTGERLSSLA